MSDGENLLAQLATRYDGFRRYRDVFVSSLGGDMGDSVDARALRRKYVTTCVKGKGIRVEHIRCFGEERDLRSVVVWNCSLAFMWRCNKGWTAINGLQSALSVSNAIVPYVLLSSSNAALQFLGVVDVSRNRSHPVDTVKQGCSWPSQHPRCQ